MPAPHSLLLNPNSGEYNRERPHGALKGLTPVAFAERYASRKEVDYATQLAYP